MNRKTLRPRRSRRAGADATGVSTTNRAFGNRASDQTATGNRVAGNRGERRARKSRRPGIGTVAGVGLALAVAAVALPLTHWMVHRLADRHARRSREQRGLDALTGLPNQAEAAWWLNIRLQRARARSHRLAVMVLDINDFAECNDTYGREVGDHILQVTGARMQAQLRTGDMICRTGSDTFMVIMDAIGPDHLAAKVGERIVAAVAEPISYHGEPIKITASLGFALSQERDTGCELLLDRADRALIQAKAAGRSIVQF
jgi:diguanylate cyclase (GGDEF)-like protein